MKKVGTIIGGPQAQKSRPSFKQSASACTACRRASVSQSKTGLFAAICSLIARSCASIRIAARSASSAARIRMSASPCASLIRLRSSASCASFCIVTEGSQKHRHIKRQMPDAVLLHHIFRVQNIGYTDLIGKPLSEFIQRRMGTIVG